MFYFALKITLGYSNIATHRQKHNYWPVMYFQNFGRRGEGGGGQSERNPIRTKMISL